MRLGAIALGVLAYWSAAPDAAAESSDGEDSAETAPVDSVEDATGAVEAPAAADEESEDETPKPDAAEDGPAEVFVPSENISEDISVPFPVDI